MANSSSQYNFLSGGGETAGLIRHHDWAATPLGPIEKWPPSLCATVGILLHSAFPTLLLWGEDLVCFYNDPFVPSLGVNGKHPSIGKKGREMWADIWDTIHPLFQQVMSTGKAVAFEDLLVPFYRNGRTEEIYWTFSYSPAYDDRHQINGIFVTCHETTRRVLAIRELTQINEELAFAIEAAELGTWDYNPQAGTFTANSRLKTWFGFKPQEEIPLTHALAIIHPDDLPLVEDAIRRAVDPGIRARYDIEYTIIAGPGLQPREVRARGKAYFDETGTAIRLNGTLQDITEQKNADKKEQQARRQVEENERIFRTTILNAPLAICILKGENFIVEIANNHMLELWDKTAAAVLNKPIVDGIPEARDQGFEALLSRVYTTGEGYNAQNMPIRLERNGVIREEFVDFLFEAQVDAPGKVIGILAVATLVTPQVTAMRKIEETVAARTADLASANRSLKRSNDELSQFAYVTSHDLQEPIRKASIFASMLRNELGEIPPITAGYFEKINGAHKKMSALIQDILHYSELGAKGGVFTSVDLQQIVNEVITDYELVIAQGGATVIVEGLPVITAIPLQMTQLFSNLLSNALKFTRPDIDPEITISASHENGHTYITMADNGIGIDPRYADRIFDIFQRLHRSTDYVGNGIGLALVRKIMDNHHGAIAVSSTTGQGSIFRLHFPPIA